MNSTLLGVSIFVPRIKTYRRNPPHGSVFLDGSLHQGGCTWVVTPMVFATPATVLPKRSSIIDFEYEPFGGKL